MIWLNIKKRLENKAFVVSMAVTIVTFIYQILGMFGIVSPISQDVVIQIIGLLSNLAVSLGVLIDPTTVGVKDSKAE